MIHALTLQVCNFCVLQWALARTTACVSARGSSRANLEGYVFHPSSQERMQASDRPDDLIASSPWSALSLEVIYLQAESPLGPRWLPDIWPCSPMTSSGCIQCLIISANEIHCSFLSSGVNGQQFGSRKNTLKRDISWRPGSLSLQGLG
jgi:hypothetical protein